MEKIASHEWGKRRTGINSFKRWEDIRNWRIRRVQQRAFKVSIMFWLKNKAVETNRQNETCEKSIVSCSPGRWDLRNWRIRWVVVHVLSWKIRPHSKRMDWGVPNEYCTMHSFFNRNLWNAGNLRVRRIWFFASKFSLKIQSNHKRVGKNAWYARC